MWAPRRSAFEQTSAAKTGAAWSTIASIERAKNRLKGFLNKVSRANSLSGAECMRSSPFESKVVPGPDLCVEALGTRYWGWGKGPGGLPSRLTVRGSIGAGARDAPPSARNGIEKKGRRRSLSLDQRTAALQLTQWPECSLYVAGLFPGRSNGNRRSALARQLPDLTSRGELLYSDSWEDLL